jgi:rhodanese-related sulfurtransferase
MTVSVITPRELVELCSQGKTVELIDVRTPVEFREVHVEIARNVPLESLDPAAVMQARSGSKSDPLYVVCRSGSRGRQACEKFLAAGFTNVVTVEGGTMACVACGMLVVRGKKAVSVERQVRIVAGLLVLVGAVLAWFVDPAFVGLSAFIVDARTPGLDARERIDVIAPHPLGTLRLDDCRVGDDLIFAGITDTCPMGMTIARMPWNQIKEPTNPCCAKKEACS